ncbi:MAG TPA: toll/interleukin-1 receptor domain-containing protein [Bryobacteraceae bacterium]|jgi:hypothetical protein|nr:toll/interleukin-1 receptor domain-containing protein [Bryobacteraceae bacterium]
MKTAVLCFCESDEESGVALAEFLSKTCPVTIEMSEGRLRPGFDLLDAAALAISADVAIILLSPDSVPRSWPRERWEPVLTEEAGALGTRVAFVMLRDCKFPALFRRRDFFDFSGDPVSARRRLKHWLLGGNPVRAGVPDITATAPEPPEFASLALTLADGPGVKSGLTAAQAFHFANAFAPDFEGLIYVDCFARTRAGILGDVADALGLRLTQRAEKNREALEQVCRDRRLLFIFENLEAANRGWASFGGLSSIIFTGAGTESRHPLGFEETLKLFAAWPSNEDACLRALGDAHFALHSSVALHRRLQLGENTSAFLRHRNRLAEAYEVLDSMAGWLRDRGDTLGLHRVAWDQSWILDHWGETPSAPPSPESLFSVPEQLSLDW